MQKRREAYRIVNLKIDEVSTVKSGAGVGCEVKFRKMHEDKEPFAMSEFELAIQEQQHAQAMYPDLPAYKALAKWLNSDVGKKISALRNREIYERDQRKSAVGNGLGVTDRAGYNNTYATSAADQDGTQSASPFSNAPSAVDKNIRR